MNETIEALIDIGVITGRVIEKALAPWLLSPAQLRILLCVQEKSLTPSELAALLLQETHSVSGLLNRLEDRELIDRARDRSDRRVVHVSLTLTGKRVVRELTPALDEAQKRISGLACTRLMPAQVYEVRDLLIPLVGGEHGTKLAVRKRAQSQLAS